MNEQENILPTETQEQTPVSPVTEAPAVHPITKAVKSQKFLAICILYSFYFGLPVIASLNSNLNFNVIGLLFTIGLWMVYANGQKISLAEPLAFTAPNLLSGTVKACRIITLVLSILFMVSGVLCGICVPILNAAPDFKEEIVGEFQAIQLIVGNNVFRFADHPDMAGAILIGCAICLILAGVLCLVLYYCFFYRYLHRLTYSICENLKHGSEIDYGPALRKWMLVLGILTAVSALLSQTTFVAVANGCSGAAMIVTSIWLKENFETK